MTDRVALRFAELCAAFGRHRRGFTLPDLAGLDALARELEAERPDAERADELAADLGLMASELHRACTNPSQEESQLELLGAGGAAWA